MSVLHAVSGRRPHPAILLASLGGVGQCGLVPATVASALVAGAYLLLPLHAGVQLGVLACVIVLGVWSAGVSASAARESDPRHVVIDEAAGMLIACFLLPKSVPLIFVVFLLFRLFDIGKWFPMKQLERLPGGWGIVADDLAAGLLARLCLLPWV